MTDGEYDGDPVIKIDWMAGNCPVQAEGTIDGKPFYFRARHEHWSFHVGGDVISRPEWGIRERYSDEEYAAGWMTQYEALGFIAHAVGLYAKHRDETLSTDAPTGDK